MHDNFFEIGGDSILLLRAWTRMKEILGGSMPLSAFLSRPTISGHQESTDMPANIRRLNDAPSSAPALFCLHPGFGLSNEYRALAAQAGRDFAVFGVESPIHSDPAWTASSMQALAAHYLATIRKVQPQGPYRLIGWSFGGWVALEIAKLIKASADGQLALVGLVDTEPCTDFRPFAKTAAEWRDAVANELARLDLANDLALSERLLSIATLHQSLLLDYSLKPVSLGLKTHVWWAEATTSFHRRRGQANYLDWTAFLPSGTASSIVHDSSHGDIIKNPTLLRDLHALVTKSL
ncbi:thioesterase domain-containing protein [Sinorhizobium sp. CB7]|uniref:thioesterase domain-containing protein n=1 Tax=Sinorhizobium sp. CB7 TaxID=3056949 RepID=UPI0035238B61